MTHWNCDHIISEVLAYLEEQLDGAPDDRLMKYIDAGDTIAADEERAEILIQAVVAVVARQKKEPLARIDMARNLWGPCRD